MINWKLATWFFESIDILRTLQGLFSSATGKSAREMTLKQYLHFSWGTRAKLVCLHECGAIDTELYAQMMDMLTKIERDGGMLK